MLELLFSRKRVLEDFSLLLLRLFIGGIFFVYGVKKIQTFDNYVTLFADKIAMPFPIFNLYLVIFVEVVGGLMLIFGVLSRVASIPLIATMIVAMLTVNIHNGFPASKFGIELNLAYIAILLIIFSFGSGKVSVDNKILNSKQENKY